MIGPRNVHPDELGEADGMDLQDALRVGNRLLEAMDEAPMPTREEFVDNVMAALADEPTPGTTGFLVPLRRGGLLGGFRESFRQAWASVGGGRPVVARSVALAYVLAVVVAGVSLTGAAALGTAGALGVFDPTPTNSPPPPAPTVAPPTVAPSPSEIAPEPTLAPSPSPTETDDETDDTDDSNDDNSGPGGGGDDDSRSGDDDSSGPGGNASPGSSPGSNDSGPGSANSRPGSANSGTG